MARLYHRLKATDVRSLTAPGRYPDGDGLYLKVSPTGAQSWVFRFRDRMTGRDRNKGLGPVRLVTLPRARELARQCQTELRAGVRLIDDERAERARARMAGAARLTFGECVAETIASKAAGWKAGSKSERQWQSTLQTYAGHLFERPVESVTTDDVLAVLKPIWDTKTETASRLRERIEAVIAWAKARERFTGENPARWRGHLDSLLAKPSKVKVVRNHPAMPWQQMFTCMQRVKERDSDASRALQLAIMTATRISEVVGSRWQEFNFEEGIWTIPAERTKKGRALEIPLVGPLRDHVDGIPRTGEFLFPGYGKRPTLSTEAVLKVLRKLVPEYEVTTHGFRSAFRDWASEATSHDDKTIKMAQGHAIADKTEKAYRRGTLLAKREALLRDWWAHCDTKPQRPSLKSVA